MNWQEVCKDPNLKDLPYKIELNRLGQIVMSPVKVIHSLLQGEIQRQLERRLTRGKALPECAVRTREGTKVADVAWLSAKRLKIVRDEIECSVAPEICIEVISESNTDSEMAQKRRLYFEAGAQEFWTCDEKGRVAFYTPEGAAEISPMIPDFPHTINI